MRRFVFAKCQGPKEKVLLGQMPLGMEKQESQAGELEEYKDRCMPCLRKEIPGKQGIQGKEKILQPRLFKQGKGDGKEKR